MWPALLLHRLCPSDGLFGTLEDGAHAEGVTEFLFIRASDVSTANGRTLLSRLVSILSASRSMG